MADLTKTITNTLTVLGPTPASEWGSMVWGQDNWGETKDFELEIGKWLAESVNLTDAYNFGIAHKISEGFSVSSSIDLVALQDGSGYTYILKGASDPNDRYFPTYTEQTASDPSYTEDTANDPGWSDA